MRNLFLGWKVSGDGDTTREKLLTSTSSSSAEGASASSSSAGTSAADGLWGKLLEPISPRVPRSPDEWLYNQDCAPTMKAGRILTARDMGSLWVALVVGVPTYYLAGSLVEMGMAWWQGILTVLLANVIVLIPMVLSAHAGTKFGIPFPVIARASFGIRGANVPSLLRAFLCCGWFGIQTWIGGQAIFQLLNTLLVGHPHAQSPWPLLPWLGISAPEFASFLLCWLLQLGFIWNGIASIKELERYSAPILIVLSATLLAWAYIKAGGFGPILSAPSQFVPGGAKAGQFWQVFFPALTANVGYWVGLSLNIPGTTLL
jgi:NCS1 family nucleobase:cation symporter-1